MSYILEAIKRSERQRLVTGVGALRTVPVFGEVTKPTPLLLYGTASAILVAAGIGIGWLRPWQAHLPSAVSITVPGRPPALSSADAAPPVERAEELHVMRVQPYRPPEHAHPEPRKSARASLAGIPATPPAMPNVTAPDASPARPAAGTRSVAPGPATERAAMPDPAAPDVAAPSVATALAAANPPDVAGPPAAAAGGIRALYELPPQVLRDIPAMAISGFIYSDSPAGRMVYINDRLVQEGQYVADGLKLEQITPESLIFSYRNYRFRKYLR